MCYVDIILLFYVQGLGFVVDWEYCFEFGFLLFVQFICDGQMIFFIEYSGDCEVGGVVYFIVDDVDSLYCVFSVVNVLIEQLLYDIDWGSCEMLLCDFDGNCLCFVIYVD